CFDAEWIRWNNIHSRTNRLLHNNTLFFLGTEHGPGFGFRDQIGYRVGVDYTLSDCWTVRAGFRHIPTPVRSSEAFFNTLTLDLVQNYITVGATYRYNCVNEFSAFFAYGFRHKLKGENSIPLIPFGGGTVSICEEKWAVGIEWSWLF
ncbi:MAG: outer membrane protein transport protein, partial [Parachlamydia sp.]|nr:outer membrane protein transport protein [Parachlamydia sp.]